MGSLLDRFKEEANRPVSVRCTVGQAMEHDEYGEDIAAALEIANLSAASMSRTLRDVGINLTPGTLNRHRRGECLCE